MRKFMLLALILALWTTASIPGAMATDTNNLSTQEMYDNLTFRKEFGLEANKEAMDRAYKQGKKGEFGVYLTSEEQKDIEQRFKRQEQVPLVEKKAKEMFKESFSGIYIDQTKKGRVVVGLKNLESLDKNKKSELESLN